MALARNQNWSRSSFPETVKMGNFIAFAILKNGKGGGGVSEGVSFGGECGGKTVGWGISGNPSLIN